MFKNMSDTVKAAVISTIGAILVACITGVFLIVNDWVKDGIINLKPTITPTLTSTIIPTHTLIPTSTLIVTETPTPSNPPPPLPSDNPANADFEQGLESWRVIGNVTSNPGRNGLGAQVSYENGDAELFQILSTPLIKGKTYQIIVWCKAETGGYCSLTFGDIDSDFNLPNGENYVEKTISGNGDWQELSIQVTLSKDEIVSLYLDGKTSSRPPYTPQDPPVVYDDVQIIDITE